MQTPVLTPETQVDDTLGSRAPSRTATALAALGVGAASLGTALLTDAVLVASALALLALVLGISALTGAKGRRGRFVAGTLAIVLSLGSVASMVLADDQAAATSGQMAAHSEVTGSPVDVSFGALVPNRENGSTTVTVTVTNVSDATVSTWASISAESKSGKKTYAAQGVGVRDLEPGDSSTQQITFGAVLPESTVFVVKDVL